MNVSLQPNAYPPGDKRLCAVRAWRAGDIVAPADAEYFVLCFAEGDQQGSDVDVYIDPDQLRVIADRLAETVAAMGCEAVSTRASGEG